MSKNDAKTGSQSTDQSQPDQPRPAGLSRRQALHWMAATVPAAGVVGWAACDTSSGAGGDPDAGGNHNDAAVSSPDGHLPPQDGVAPDGSVCEATGEDALGPFWEDGAPTRTVLAEANEPGPRTFVQGTVYGPDCETPLADALVDVWHADADGNYHDAGTQYRLRGQMQTDAQGRYAFESIRPGNYSNRPRHYHFNVSAPGHVPLTTQLYFAGDPFLGDSDSCQRPTCNSHDPARIVDFTSDQDPNGTTRYHGTFDITLSAI